jgi:hypothetical protein
MPDVIATVTAVAAAAAAVAGTAAAIATIVLAKQTGRLAAETRATTVHDQEQLELLRRDRDLRLRPMLEFHGCGVGPGTGPQGKAAVLAVSNYGQGLAVNAFCVGECQDQRPDERLAVEPYVSVRPVHIRPGAENIAIEMQRPVEGGLHAELLKPTDGVYSEQRGDGRYALFCLDETGRTLYRFLFGQPAVDRWMAGEPTPPWAVEVLRRVQELKPEGADLNALLNP